LTGGQSPRGSSDGLAASLQSGDIQAIRRQLASQLEADPDPMVELQLAQLDYISYDFDLALGRAEAAFATHPTVRPPSVGEYREYEGGQATRPR
jgi:hypothetical protein